MKIVIINQHTCNRGDEAAGRSVIESLLSAFPDSTVDVLYRFDGDYPPIGKDTERVHHYPQYKHKYNKSFMLIYYLELAWNFLLGFLRIKNGYIGSTGQIYKIIANSDIVINAPTGPNIGDIYKDKIYMLNLIFAEISGKKTFMYGSSVGPFNIPWVRKWSKFLFERMSIICVREDVSLNNLKTLDLKNKNIYSSLDAAVQRKINPKNAERYYSDAGFELNTHNVGFTPLAFPWYPLSIRNEKTQQKIEENIANIINKITENGDTNIFFFPQLFSLKQNDVISRNDMPIINSIISKVKQPEFCKILPNEYDSDIQQAMISKLDYFIGMRYHSLVFSIKMGIPAVGICYEHKASGFLKKVGLKELIIQLEELYNNPDIVLEKIKYIKENTNSIRKEIALNIPNLQILSNKGTKLIKEYLEKK